MVIFPVPVVREPSPNTLGDPRVDVSDTVVSRPTTTTPLFTIPQGNVTVPVTSRPSVPPTVTEDRSVAEVRPGDRVVVPRADVTMVPDAPHAEVPPKSSPAWLGVASSNRKLPLSAIQERGKQR